MKLFLLTVFVFGVALSLVAEAGEASAIPHELESDGIDGNAGPSLEMSPVIDGLQMDVMMDVSSEETQDASVTDWLEPLRVSLKHEASYKLESPEHVVNNRSSVRMEYSRLFHPNYFVQLDTKLNLHWGNDHRAEAENEDALLESVTREAYVQSSFGDTSVRAGYQILIWGVSEGGAITDEISPRNLSEIYFVSLEESRIGQPMVTIDHFSQVGVWNAFFVPSPAYNKYPEAGTEYDISGVFDAPEPKQGWHSGEFEYGLHWKHTFGRSDISLMAADLIDNDYLVRKQRLNMYGLTANLASGNLLYRAEIAMKQPKAFFAQPTAGGALSIVESDELDASLGFDFSPGGRALTFSAEVIRSHLLDWDGTIVGRERNADSFVGSVTNRFLNDDLTLTWMTTYSRPYTSYLHQFLSSYRIDDNSSLYFELYYPDEQDERSGSWAYSDQKQVVIKYLYQF